MGISKEAGSKSYNHYNATVRTLKRRYEKFLALRLLIESLLTKSIKSVVVMAEK
jgi:hypothetical protein